MTKYLALIVTSLILTLGCSSKDKKIDANTPEGAYELARSFEEDERYEEAIAYYAEIKNKHQYSRLAVESELHIADIYFKRESFIEAENAYKLFKEFHPKHPKIDYVTFQLGLSYFKQLPSTIDRDLSLADKAILYFNEVIRTYPDSQYASSAQKYKSDALKMLAEKEHYIANFYFIRDRHQSALERFEHLLKTYPNLGLDAKALYGAAVSAFEVKDLKKAKTYYDKLIAAFPGSAEAAQAKKEVGDELK